MTQKNKHLVRSHGLLKHLLNGRSGLTVGPLLLMVAAQSVAAPIDVNAPLLQWQAVAQDSRFDSGGDQRGLFRLQLDLVGDALHPMLAVAYDDKGTPDDTGDDEFGLRVRLGGAGELGGFDGELWLGVDLERDGDLDALIQCVSNGELGDQFSGQVSVYALEPGASESPRSIVATDPTLIADLADDGHQFSVIPVDAITDPAARSFDLNNNGVNDVFVSFRVNWADLAAAINSKPLSGELGTLIGTLDGGLGITPFTPVQWVVYTESRGQRMAGDVAGYDDQNDSLRLSYAEQGAFLPALSFGNLFPQIISDGGRSEAEVRLQERAPQVTRVQALDADGDPVTYRISGGVDAAVFSINSTTGSLEFNSPPRFADPQDQNGANRYQVEVEANDGRGGWSKQLIHVEVQGSGLEADLAFSELWVTPEFLVADGQSTADVYLRLRDADGMELGLGGDSVEIQVSAGAVSAVTDERDGRYFATYTAGTRAERVTITAAVNGQALAEQVEIELVAGEPDPGRTRVEVADEELLANGESTTRVSVGLWDANDNPIAMDDGLALVQAELGLVSSLQDGGDGFAEAIYTAPVDLDAERVNDTLRVLYDGRAVGESNLILLMDVDELPEEPSQPEVPDPPDEPDVPDVPDPPDEPDVPEVPVDPEPEKPNDPPELDLGRSELQISAGQLPADGVATAEVRIQLRDSEGESYQGSQNHIELDVSAGTIGAVTDEGDGLFTASFTAGTAAQMVVITATVNGERLPETVTVVLQATAVDPMRTEIRVENSQLLADGQSHTTITIRLRDRHGNTVNAADHPVSISADLGSVDEGTTNNQGHFTARYSAPARVDESGATATLAVRVNGEDAAKTEIELLFDPQSRPDPDPDPDAGPEPDPGTTPAPDPDTEPGEKPDLEGGNAKVKTAVRGAGSLDLLGLLSGMLILLGAKLGRSRGARKPLLLSATFAALCLPNMVRAHFHDCEPDNRINFEEVYCWYGGISLGQSQLAPEIIDGAWTLTEESDTAVGLLFGYQFLPHWFAELAYHDLGQAGFSGPAAGEGSEAGLAYRVPSFMLGYNVAEPLAPWNFYLKAGIARIMNSSTDEQIEFETGSSAQLAVAAGLQFNFNSHWLLRVEGHSFDRDAHVFGLTLVRRGGFMKWSGW